MDFCAASSIVLRMLSRILIFLALGFASLSHAADGDTKFPDPAPVEKEPTDEQKKIIAALILNLADQQYDARKAAKEALMSLGAVAIGQLKVAAKESTDAEVRRVAGNI